MPMVMLISMMLVMLSAALIPSVVDQSRVTIVEHQRSDALQAAQSGLEVAQAQIRAASDTSGTLGNAARLPCGPFRGSISAAGSSRYGVTITYWDSNPNDPSVTPHRVPCAWGNGTTPSVPAFAAMCAAGTQQAQPTVDDWNPATCSFGHVGDRVLTGSYIFRTSDANVAGGPITVFNDGAVGHNVLCWDTASSTAGTPVLAQVCSPGAVSQKFTWNSNLQVVLASTASTANPMCVDAGVTHTVGEQIYLQSCLVPVNRQQQWGYVAGLSFEGSLNASGNDGFCVAISSVNTPNSALILTQTNCGGNNTTTGWLPDLTTGAGAAGDATSQLVNFGQFGRCLDLTNANVSQTFMIAYPCKQDWYSASHPTSIAWNQQFSLNTTTNHWLVTNQNHSTPYCLRTPATGPLDIGQTAAYVTVVLCSGQSNQTVVQWTGHTDPAQSYAQRYTITDSYGNCLVPSLTTFLASDGSSITTNPSLNQISTIIVAPCDGTKIQKWNAPASSVPQAPLLDVTEK
jgi:type II secretory pathway pseudopilin PulG